MGEGVHVTTKHEALIAVKLERQIVRSEGGNRHFMGEWLCSCCMCTVWLQAAE